MFRVSFSTKGLEKVKEDLGRLYANAVDFRPVWLMIQQSFYGVEQEQFATLGHGEWPPLSENYARWKSEKVPGKQMMELTGAAKRSLTGETEDSIVIMEPTRLVLGSRARSGAIPGVGDFTAEHPYLVSHQMGIYGRPQRKLIDIGPDIRDQWMQMMKAHIFGTRMLPTTL